MNIPPPPPHTHTLTSFIRGVSDVIEGSRARVVRQHLGAQHGGVRRHALGTQKDRQTNRQTNRDEQIRD